MGPLEQGDYGNNYNQTIYSGFDPGKIVGFGGSGSATGGNEGGSSFGISVPGVAGFLSDLVNALFQRGENKRNREFAAQQAQLQNQWNLEQWYRENAYNTPLAQMQRYIDAGLNPNLFFGQQNLAASSPQMVSGKDAPAGVAPQVDLGTAALQAAQVKNLNAQTEYVDQQSLLTQEQIKQVISSIGVNEANTDLLSQQVLYYQQCVDNLISDKEQTIQQTSLIKQQARIAYMDYLFNSETFDSRVKQFQAEADISYEKAKNIAKYVQATIFGLNSQAQYYLSLCQTNAAEAEYLSSLSNSQWIKNYVDAAWAFGTTYDESSGKTRTGAEWNAFARSREDIATYNNILPATDASTQLGILTAELTKKYGGAKELAGIINLYANSLGEIGSLVSWRRSNYSADNPRMTAKTKIGAADTRIRLGR